MSEFEKGLMIGWLVAWGLATIIMGALQAKGAL